MNFPVWFAQLLIETFNLTTDNELAYASLAGVFTMFLLAIAVAGGLLGIIMLFSNDDKN
jgi:hypothetical protein